MPAKQRYYAKQTKNYVVTLGRKEYIVLSAESDEKALERAAKTRYGQDFIQTVNACGVVVRNPIRPIRAKVKELK